MKYSTSLIFFAAAVASVHATATNANDACDGIAHHEGSSCKWVIQVNGKDQINKGDCVRDSTQKNMFGKNKLTCQMSSSTAGSAAAGASGAAGSAGALGAAGASGSAGASGYTGASGSTDSSSGGGMAGSADSSSAGSSTASTRRRGMMKRRLDSMDYDELD